MDLEGRIFYDSLDASGLGAGVGAAGGVGRLGLGVALASARHCLHLLFGGAAELSCVSVKEEERARVELVRDYQRLRGRLDLDINCILILESA